VDRGIVSGFRKGLVLLPEAVIMADVGLLESEKFGAYVLLTAMGIRPGRMLTSAVSDVLPCGLSQRVAVGVCNVWGLPWECAVRFLSADGRFPGRYVRSLEGYATAVNLGLESELDDPLDYGSWKVRQAFSPLGVDNGPEVRIPVESSGELEAVLVFVAAASEQVYEPEPTFKVSDDGDSGPEEVSSGRRRYVRAVGRPANIDDQSGYRVEEVPVAAGFSYDVPLGEQATVSRRVGMVVPGLVTDQLGADGCGLGVPEVERFKDEFGRDMVRVIFDERTPVEYRSPGGTKKGVIPSRLWDMLASGQSFTGKAFSVFMKVASSDPAVFAESTVFGGWSNSWISVLGSLSIDENVSHVALRGLSSVVMALVAGLWTRFVRGQYHAVQVSNYSLSYWGRLVRSFEPRASRRTQRRQIAEVTRGDAHLAQSDAFLDRLRRIRLGFADVMRAFEDRGFYSPDATAQMQRVLPVSSATGYQVYDAVRCGRAVVAPGSRRGGGVGFPTDEDGNILLSGEGSGLRIGAAGKF